MKPIISPTRQLKGNLFIVDEQNLAVILFIILLAIYRCVPKQYFDTHLQQTYSSI